MNGLRLPRNTGAAAMHGSIIFTLCALVSCAPKNSKKSSAKEFENSANICLAISNFAANRSKLDGNQDPESIFADKKLSERRILVDLIGSYQGVLANLEAPAVKPPATPDSQSVVSSGKPQTPSTNNTDSSTNPQPSSSPSVSYNPSPTNSSQPPSIPSSNGSAAGCRSFANIGGYSGIPPHYSQIKDANLARSIVARYCTQLQTLDAPSCKYTPPTPPNNQAPKGTKLCADLGPEKPSFLDDNCEVINAATIGGLNKIAGEACKIIGVAAAKANPEGCSADVLIGVCSAQAKASGDVINYLNAANPSKEQLTQQTIDTISGAFYKTAFSCIRNIGSKAVKKAIKENVGNAAAYWTSKLGKDYVQKVLTDYKPNVAINVAKEAAFALCSAGANAVANQIGALPPDIYENDCGPLTEAEQQAQVASCFRTVSSGCDALAGKVDFANMIGAKSGGLKVTADVVSSAVQTGCQFAGTTSKVACGLISESTKAIIQAIRTGNNSWADCAGSKKLGQCIGSRLGSGGWTNNNGVSEPTGSGDVLQRDCCWCQRTWYENDWGFDTPYKRENNVGVIQQGEFKTGNCARPGGVLEGHKFWDSSFKGPKGWDAYYSYGQCRKVTLKGDSCLTGVEYYENGQPSGYVIRKGSWNL